ncbi:ion transporter [Klenkia sp. LSe6-5]|uniref:Ion transporter n=1 Tax=Klenkia sesuvii TaxID=3103137 RepID=A0ABU8DQT5_9ACTN
MRTLVVTGPGGAGSSTVAAATALALADAGRPVALLTTHAPAVPAVAERVVVRVVAPVESAEAAWGAHLDQLAALVPALALPPSSSVVPLPGVDEVALLTEWGRLAAGDVDVVLDAGPLERATAVLALPHAARWWLAQLAPPRLRVLASVRALTRSRPGAVEAALAAASALEAALGSVPAGPEVHLVLAPDDRALPALRRAGAGLGLLGHRLASVTLARVVPPSTGSWGQARREQQDDVKAALRAAGVQPAEVVEAPRSPSDVEGLRALGAAVAPAAPTGPLTPLPHRGEAGWELTVPLPYAGRGEVDLTRWGDELVVGTAGLRRSLPLDPLLRRCTVTAAAVTDPGSPGAALRVRFAADPTQWPADLLAAEVAR